MNYKDTLNLPSTSFSMKANLAQKEPKILKQWQDDNLYEQCLEQHANDPQFILHDGPPYANGHIHIGHALNKTLKDIILKYKTMCGHHAPYVPGWDCHGLPIEHQVTSKLGSKAREMSKLQLRAQCHDYAQKHVDIQSTEFQRLGILGEWDKPYLTMTHEYEAGILQMFASLVDKGYIVKGFKPIHWCMTCATALAEAEIEYDDHQSPSVYVKFALSSDLSTLDSKLAGRKASMLIWTTTPWTLPANVGIAVHPDFIYQAVLLKDEVLILAKELVPQLQGALEGVSLEVLAEFKGRDLEGLTYDHPFMDSVPGLEGSRKVILAPFVTAEDGTGCVHIAPGHGEDDFRVGMQNGLPAFAPVGPYGKFTEDVPLFAGQKVFKANPLVIETLQEKGALLAQAEISHSYPHCWRCKKAVIFRATEQWFIDVDHKDLRQSVLKEIGQVTWHPQWGETRITEMVKNRPNWCISRQRSWGVPIPVFYCTSCDEAQLSGDLVRHVAEQVRIEGCDLWFAKEAKDILPEGTECSKCSGQEFRKETDILDVWFDSGASSLAVCKQRDNLNFPADLYLEGSDQHRGWFQSSIFLAMAGLESTPFRSILTHGFVVDGKGKKMSKSQGNVIKPQEITDKYGADILRLWVSSADYSDDVRISDGIVQQKIDAYRKIRNTCRYILGNAHDFDPSKDSVPYDQMLEIDRFALSAAQSLLKKVTDAYEQFQFHRVFLEITQFCNLTMSSFYLDILKDRLYADGKKSLARRSAQTAIYEILKMIVKMIAPVMPFTAEEIWSAVPAMQQEHSSVHLSAWPQFNQAVYDQALEQNWQRIEEIRAYVLKAIEELRNRKEIGSSLEAAVKLDLAEQDYAFLKDYEEQLPAIFIVSRVDLNCAEDAQRKVEVSKMDAAKCVRCWVFSDSVGQDSEHPELCARCVRVLKEECV